MVDQVTDIAAKLGMGGRLYRDARERDAGDAEPTPEPKVETHSPQIPKPWMVSAVQDELEEIKKEREPRDWQQIHATLLQLLGMAVLTGGVSLIYVPAGLIVLGVCFVVLGIATGLPATPKPPQPRHKR